MSEFWRHLFAAPGADSAPLLVYQIAVTFLAVLTLLNALGDWFAFQRPEDKSGTKTLALPSLSVLIPARNEALNIAACVESLLNQNYRSALEILVLDDRSDDATGDIVQKIIDSLPASEAEFDRTVRLVHGGEVWTGWKGKPNALRQLAAAANGDLLLLTDADCIFEPGAMAAAAAHREKVGADCLSLIPHLECNTFWENLIIPLQYFVIFATLPVRNIYANPNPAFAAANGAFILIPAAIYAAIGGHEAVKGEMAEDVLFARYIKRSHLRLVYGDGTRTYRVRMYNSLREIWDGFSKNLFSAMGRSLAIVSLWCAFVLTTQILPFVFFAIALMTGNRSVAGFTLPLIQVGVALLIRIALAARFRLAFWAVPLHPLGWIIFLCIALNSAYLGLSGKGYTWKGRVYTG